MTGNLPDSFRFRDDDIVERPFVFILLFGPAEPFFHPGRKFKTLSRADAVKTGPLRAAVGLSLIHI